MENYPEDTFSPGRACLASWTALGEAQLILVPDDSKMLPSWEVHLYSRKLSAINNLRLASTVVPPVRAATCVRWWPSEFRAQAFQR